MSRHFIPETVRLVHVFRAPVSPSSQQRDAIASLAC